MAQSSINSPVLRIGSRGSPLALVAGARGARPPRRSLRACAGTDRYQGHPHHRRCDPGPAAGGSRRQRPVHQGNRGGAAGRRHRPRGAFVEGHADAAARGPRPRRRFCRARMRAMPSSAARPKASRELPQGATVGTASLRRQALLKHLRPDLAVAPLRGNVETRLRKLDSRRSRRDAARGRRTEAARPAWRRPPRCSTSTTFLPGSRPRRDRPRDPRGRRTDPRARRRDQRCRYRDRADRRARLPCRARRLLPHADCRPRARRRRHDPLSRHDREDRRQRSARGHARGPPRRRGGARRRRRPRA